MGEAKGEIPKWMFATMGGVAMTMVKFHSQLEHVETAFAFARVLRGLISAGYSQGSGSQVAPKNAMYKKRPKAAPCDGAVLAGSIYCGIKQAKVMTIDKHWPIVPARKSLRRPTCSISHQDEAAKIE